MQRVNEVTAKRLSRVIGDAHLKFWLIEVGRFMLAGVVGRMKRQSILVSKYPSDSECRSIFVAWHYYFQGGTIHEFMNLVLTHHYCKSAAIVLLNLTMTLCCAFYYISISTAK